MKAKILIIDKKVSVSNLILSSESSEDHSVISATDITRARELIDEHTPDIIIANSTTGGMIPPDLIDEIKKKSCYIEVIVIIDAKKPAQGTEFLKHGASDFLIPPVTSDALHIAIQRALEKISMKKNQNTGFFDLAPCYISVHDRDHITLSVNKKFRETFGDKTGSFCYEIYKKRSSPCQDCPMSLTFTDGNCHQTTAVLTTKTGTPINVLNLTAPVYDENGEFQKVMILSTDITSIIDSGDSLSALGLMISSISHGVKGLLTGLDGGMYLLDSGFRNKNNEEVDEGWEVTKLMVSRIRTLVLDILYHARMRQFKWEQVDINTFLSDLVAIFKAKITIEGIELVLDTEQGIGDFEIDNTGLSTALVNILENALDTCIEDRIKNPNKQHKITVKARKAKDQLRLYICDNGTGMDEETRKNIFTIFFSSKGEQGTGLGLFIAHKIILKHGGSITVDSSPENGTGFIIKLPLTLPASIKNSVNTTF